MLNVTMVSGGNPMLWDLDTLHSCSSLHTLTLSIPVDEDTSWDVTRWDNDCHTRLLLSILAATPPACRSLQLMLRISAATPYLGLHNFLGMHWDRLGSAMRHLDRLELMCVRLAGLYDLPPPALNAAKIDLICRAVPQLDNWRGNVFVLPAAGCNTDLPTYSA